LPDAALKRTPLHALHVSLGARLVPFAGYEMPVQYPLGILKEHEHTRAKAGLFDVSHMGQATLVGAGAATALETLVPGDIAGLADRRMRYTQFTNAAGGILDDLMALRWGDDVVLVVNAARKDADFALLQAGLAAAGVRLVVHEDRALLALQGPGAAAALARHAPEAAALRFMEGTRCALAGALSWITRSGYTGEDGFEISLPAGEAERIARLLLADPAVAPIGLGARDSLRLEAGLCLYGHDIDETTTPIEAGLAWSIGKRRREQGGFPGAAVIQKQLREGPGRKRVGLRPQGRAIAREGAAIVDGAGAALGTVTSGGFGPTVGGPVAMGYVAAAAAAPGTAVGLVVRGQTVPARTVPMPFVPHRYAK
jgi:aminomethyltransferase